MASEAPTSATAARGSVIDSEIAHFNAQAGEWWDPRGSSAMLHRLNPVRLAFLREAVDARWRSDSHSLRPLSGKRAIDVGCGAGLVCEPLARLGAEVTGLDAAPASIAAARAHAEEQGLAIEYRQGAIETLDAAPYDLVTCLEVIEHVADPAAFVSHLVRLLAPDGLMILSTPNRTPQSRLAMITLGEGLGMIPKGTHSWSQFLTPEEMQRILNDNAMTVTAWAGIGFDPGRGFVRSDSRAVNYMLSAVHSTDAATAGNISRSNR